MTDDRAWSRPPARKLRWALAGLAAGLLASGAMAASPPMPVGTGHADFPARPYAGAAKRLVLTQGQRSFRTRLSEAYREPINYGGSLVFTRIGCGTGCSFNYALDKARGRVFDFPLSGEDYPYLLLQFRKDSALIWASWGFGQDCQVQAWTLGANGFAGLGDPRGIACDEAERLLGSPEP